MKLILTIDLIPKTSFFNNVRSALSKNEWDKIRKQVYEKAYYVCEICGDVGPQHPVEAHEVWEFNDKTSTQKLVRMIALCPNCHLVKHMGFAIINDKQDVAFKHFSKVNKLKKDDAQQEIDKAFEVWDKRSKKNWKLDLTHLSEYGIDAEKIKEKKT